MWRRNEEGDCRRGMADEAMPFYGLNGRDNISTYGTRDIEYFYCKERWFMKDIFAQ